MRVISAALALMLLIVTTLTLSACFDESKVNGGSGYTGDEEDYEFIAYFGNSEDGIAIEEALSSYEVDTGIKIKSVLSDGSERGIRRQLKSDEIPAVYVLPYETDISTIEDDGYVFDLSETMTGTSGKGFPWSVNGFGLVSDTRLIAELAGAGVQVDTYAADIRLASYAEWLQFSAALEEYIVKGTTAKYTLNGHEYSFPAKKSEFLAKLNGVYAVAGADQNIMANRLLSLSFADDDVEAISESPSEDAAVRAGLNVYIATLDMLTSPLAGRFAAGIRGTDFLNEEKYSGEAAAGIFAADKAAFLVCDSDTYSSFESLNAEKAASTTMFPLKTSNASTQSGILVRSVYTMYVNKSLPDDIQKKAIDFINWYSDYSLAQNNILENSVRSYLNDGSALNFPVETKKFENFSQKSYEDKNVQTFLCDSAWDTEKLSGLMAALALDWDDSKN
jgi:hypothetical protein